MTHEWWARFILLVGAAVIVPWGLRCIRQATSGTAPAAERLTTGDLARVASALLLGLSQLLSPGLMAAAAALPWFLVTCIVSLAGLRLAWRHRHGPLWQLACACGMIYLAIGGGWALADRAGIRPLDFESAIVLLTDIHFHYAGFALAILAGLAMRRLPGKSSTFVASGVVASVPLVAVGITATQLGFSPLVELVAAWCMSLSGLGVAWLYLRLAFEPETSPISRQLWSIGALFLAAGMCLSILYGSRWLLPLPWLDIPGMRAWHGTANALGFALPVFAGWLWQVDR